MYRVRWIRPPGGAGREAESLRWDWYGERVTEQRHDGHVRREFVRIDGDSVSPVVAIEYSSSDAGNVEIRNPWCGYEAVVSVVQTASAVPSSDSPGGSGVE